MADKSRFKKIEPRFWRDEKITALDSTAKLVALYVLTAQVNRIGLFVFSPALAAEELGLTTETFRKHFDTVCDTLSWSFHAPTRTLLITSWWRTNRPDNPSALKGYLDDLLEMPSTPLLFDFVNCSKCLNTKHVEMIREAVVDRYGSVPEHGVGHGVGHGVAHQEKEKEKEKETIPSRGGAGSADADPAREGEASKPKAKRRAKAKPKADDDQPKAPTSDWVDLWRAKHEAAGSEVPINRSEIGMLLATLNRLWTQWVGSAGLDPAASAEQATASVEQLIDHWFASQLGAKRAYSVKFFCDTGALNQLLGELRAKAEGRPAPGSTGARLTYSEERDQRRREFTRTHRNDLYLQFLEPEPEGESQSQRTARFERAETLAALAREEMKKRGDSDGRFQGKRLEIA